MAFLGGYSAPSQVSTNLQVGWVREYREDNWTEGKGEALTLDEQGNIRVSGRWQGSFFTASFDPNGQEREKFLRTLTGWGLGTFEAIASVAGPKGSFYVTGIAKGSAGNPDSYNFRTGKLDAQGSVLWVKDMDRGVEDQATGLATDASGNVYVTGYSKAGGKYDYLTVKYAPDGTQLWAAIHGYANQDDRAKAIAVDRLGQVYVTGTSGTVKYDYQGLKVWASRAPNAERLLLSSTGGFYAGGTSNLFKFDENGNPAWSQSGFGFYRLGGLAGDPLGNVLLTGSRTGPGLPFLIKKFDPSGRLSWETNQAVAGGVQTYPTALAVDSDGSVYVTGLSHGGASHGFDMVTAKYDAKGSPIWSARYASSGGLNDEPDAIAVNQTGDVFVAGHSANPSPPQSSSLVLIKYSELPPIISNDPADQVVILGGTARFELGLAGTPPFRYQWRRNGSDLPGATNATLKISPVRREDYGRYDVVAANRKGSLLSPGAMLRPAFVLTISSSEGGIATRTPDQPQYLTNTVVTVTALAQPGFAFREWTGDARGTANPLTLTLDADQTVKANFEVTGTPFVVVEGRAAPIFEFTNRNTVAIELRTTFVKGALFYTLDGSPPGLTSRTYASPLTVSNSVTVRAVAYSTNFLPAESAAIPVNLWRTYELRTSTRGGGAVFLDPPGGLYRNDAVVQVTARPDPGWALTGWSGDATGAAPQLSLSMERAKSVQAIFGTPIQLFVTGLGNIRTQPNLSLYPFGTLVHLSAIPEVNHFFALWGDTPNRTTNSFFLTVTNPVPIVSAFFAPLGTNEVTLTVLANGQGSAAVSPFASVFQKGQVVTVVALPETNHRFLKWTGDVTASTNAFLLTLDQSRVITANFSASPEPVLFSPINPGRTNFQFSISGEAGRLIQIQTSTDLTTWFPFRQLTLTNTGTAVFQEDIPPSSTLRFYRAGSE